MDHASGYRLELPNIATIADGTAVAYNWHTYSDARVKSEVQPLHYGIKDIMKLNPVKYKHHSTDYIDDTFTKTNQYTDDIGFLAQDVYEVIEEVVHKPEDENDQLWTMNYEKLTPVVISAMQEQQHKIEALEKELAEMKKMLEKVMLEEK